MNNVQIIERLMPGSLLSQTFLTELNTQMVFFLSKIRPDWTKKGICDNILVIV